MLKDMAASALEEKINKIKQQNEEIRRRHEEVEEDKKKAAKLNALVQMVPSTDWPERKEPPEFSNPPRTSNKLKSVKEHHEHPQSTSGEGRKIHTFAQGQGPPPDPKYNFLADAEREEERESTKDNSNKGQKYSRGIFKKKPGGKDATQRDCRMNRGSHRDEHQPEYEAWRAERNRIDEDRISRQRTAEGNWRREWDNNKAHIVDEMARIETKLGDNIKKDFKDFDKRYHVNGNDHVSHNRGSHRSYRGNSRHFHNNYENSSNSTHYQVGHIKNLSGSEKRTVVATDKSIKITLNQGNMAKGPVMSVKVNSPSIAGTGRVGPRQRSRLTYSSHSDVEITSPDTESFSRPKSYEDRPKGIYYENLHKSSNSRKSQLLPKKKDFSNKSPYFRKKEIRREDESLQKYHEIESEKKDHKELQKFCQSKFQKHEENTAEPLQDIMTVDEKESNIIFSTESDVNNIEINNMDNQNYGNLNSHEINEGREVYTDKEDEANLKNLDLPAFEIDTEIETCEKNGKREDKLDEMQNIQIVMTFECENTKRKLTISSLENNNDENETQYVENSLCDANNTKEPIMKDKDSEQTKEILKDNCDTKQIKDMSEQENVKQDAKSSLEEKKVNSITILSSTDIHYTEKQSDKLKSDDKTSKKKVILAIEDEVATDEKINTDYKQDTTKCINEIQECTDNKEKENNVTNSIVVDKIESLKKNLHIEEKAVANDQN
ncbi:PREDICTED: myb-like protein X isoform X2 [Acromyrmex echinatior]|uniref:myb-like protein X isoform X2 n=1 Tax=Acromyrmex echinatior TaxID=103372 RepID=UPI000580F240|nr:PREDICTED: myb-like protein X isoform X2 [Acromyrmex echinatior]